MTTTNIFHVNKRKYYAVQCTKEKKKADKRLFKITAKSYISK